MLPFMKVICCQFAMADVLTNVLVGSNFCLLLHGNEQEFCSDSNDSDIKVA